MGATFRIPVQRCAFLRAIALLSGGLPGRPASHTRAPSIATYASDLGTAATTRISDALELLEGVYGSLDEPGFPRPLPEREAGTCANGNRRYLWTDAFAVLTLTSIADALERGGESTGVKATTFGEPAQFRRAANALIEAVHEGLGKPRSSSAADAMRPDDRSPTGFVGLRIGKLRSAAQTDAGMALDGQYWHYLDKWLFALVRAGHADEAAAIGKVSFDAFFDKGPAEDGRGGGIRWKVNVDATAPPVLQRARASDDTLIALIVFSLIEHHRSESAPSLRDECALLRKALRGYAPRVTDDSLGWGLEALFDGFLEGFPRTTALTMHASSALDVRQLASLPFRFYGAVLGARVAGCSGRSVASSMTVEQLMGLSVEYERRSTAMGIQEHTSINRVMLAACCVATPGAFAPQKDEPLVKF